MAIEEVIYGSVSGRRNYDVLRSSDGLDQSDLDTIRDYCNLGGSAQVEDNPTPIFLFYPLDTDGRRWAFSRTVFLGKGGRGNDYMAHVLVLRRSILDLLRWDVFLLDECFQTSKPAADELIPAVAFDAQGYEQRSRRQLQVTPGNHSWAHPSGLLRALRGRGLAVQVGDGGTGELLCRALFAALAPDDRIGLSFCSRFSFTRPMRFRLTAFLEPDASLAERNLAQNTTLVGAEVLAQRAASADPFEQWVELLGRMPEPVCGISLFSDPGQAVKLMAAICQWAEAATTGRAVPSAAMNPELVDIVEHPQNRRLSRTGRLLVLALVEELRAAVDAALALGEQPLEAMIAAAQRVRQKDPDGEVLRQFELVFKILRQGDEIASATSAVVIGLLVPTRPDLGLVHGPGNRRAFLRSPEEASEWISGLHRANPQACLGLLAEWMTAWRLSDPGACLRGVQPILSHLAPRSDAAGRILIAALERSGSASDDTRQAWFRALLVRIRPAAGAAFSPLVGARIAARQGLIKQLENHRELAPDILVALAETFPQELAEQLDWQRLGDAKTIDVLLKTCTAGLLGPAFGGPDRDIQLAQWRLASLVALRAARTRGGRDFFAELAWLLWAASRLIIGHPSPGEHCDDDRLCKALSGLVLRPPVGCTDVIARALSGFLEGRMWATPLAPEKMRTFVAQAVAEAKQNSPNRLYQLQTLRNLVTIESLLPSLQERARREEPDEVGKC